MRFPSICVVGLGYIGLPTALMFARAGHQVVGVDVDERVVAALRDGETLLHEPGLAEIVRTQVRSGRLRASRSPEIADAFILAVPTPISGLAHKRADLDAVRRATESVGPYVRRGSLVVVESTCPPGTVEQVVAPILERASALRAGDDFFLAHCPERVLPGRILTEIVENDRVLGGIDRDSAEAARELYGSFVSGQMITTDTTTAELVKLMENTQRDVNIALANEFALVAEHLGIDVWEAIEIANRHPRVNFLRPGPGVGGHCIAVDPWFVVGAAPQFTPLIAASRTVNDSMPLHVSDLVADGLGSLKGQVVVALGLTYKADVDDTRESPSNAVITILEQNGALVRKHDAIVSNDVPLEELLRDADCLLVLVDHAAYRSLDPSLLAGRMRRPLVIDTRNCLDRAAWTLAGFELRTLGRGGRAASMIAASDQRQ